MFKLLRRMLTRIFVERPVPPVPKRFDWNSREGRDLIAAEDAKMERALQRVDFAHAFAEDPADHLRHATARLHVIGTYYMIEGGRSIPRIVMRDVLKSP